MDNTRNPYIDLDPPSTVIFPSRGVYRNEMTAALEAVGRRRHTSFTSSSFGGLQSVIADDMGIGLLPLRTVDTDHVVLPKNAGSPTVDMFEVTLLHRLTTDPMIKTLTRVLSRVLAENTRNRPTFEK